MVGLHLYYQTLVYTLLKEGAEWSVELVLVIFLYLTEIAGQKPFLKIIMQRYEKINISDKIIDF